LEKKRNASRDRFGRYADEFEERVKPIQEEFQTLI
jgi:hypothetical protein